MRIAGLHVYPVKSTAPHDVRAAAVVPAGLVGDRRWIVVHPDGAKVDALRHPRILAVTAVPEGDDIVLTAPDAGPSRPQPLRVPCPPDGRLLPVGLSRVDTVHDAGDEAAAWLSGWLGTPVRLGRQAEPATRTISAAHGGREGDVLSLADTGPVLLTTTASMAALNAWIAEGPEPDPLTLRRFRPNVVLATDGDTTEAFAEDRWREIRLGSVGFRFTEHCDRCAITTIDADSGSRGREPILSLAHHRRWSGKTWFGIRMTPLHAGTVRVGDELEIVHETDGA